MTNKLDWKTANPVERIIAISEFENNWDGYGAPSFPNDIIQHSLVLLSCIFDNWYTNNINDIDVLVAPSSNPSILIELKSHTNKIELWVEYNNNRTDVVYSYFHPITLYSYDFELDQITDILGEL